MSESQYEAANRAFDHLMRLRACTMETVLACRSVKEVRDYGDKIKEGLVVIDECLEVVIKAREP